MVQFFLKENNHGVSNWQSLSDDNVSSKHLTSLRENYFFNNPIDIAFIGYKRANRQLLCATILILQPGLIKQKTEGILFSNL